MTPKQKALAANPHLFSGPDLTKDEWTIYDQYFDKVASGPTANQAWRKASEMKVSKEYLIERLKKKAAGLRKDFDVMVVEELLEMIERL